MFERLMERAEHIGAARAVRRRERLAQRLREAVPAGVAVFEDEWAVVLEARPGRFAGDAELRWLVAEARDG